MDLLSFLPDLMQYFKIQFKNIFWNTCRGPSFASPAPPSTLNHQALYPYRLDCRGFRNCLPGSLALALILSMGSAVWGRRRVRLGTVSQAPLCNWCPGSPDHSLLRSCKSGIPRSGWQPSNLLPGRENGVPFCRFVNCLFITFFSNYPVFNMPSVSCWAPDWWNIL